ncbi:hypothetical protein IZU99_07935 [Oscillospiraceae bacterium CM]|nr:hypothetical protein IZU99_07935 [Oscillospiraceae bacterium CM]
MKTVSIKNMKLFEIHDGGTPCCGGRQAWYLTGFKRLAGCGPTVFAGIINYVNRNQSGLSGGPDPIAKADFVTLMEEVWRYVTPGIQGIPTTAAFMKGARAYMDAKGLPYTLESCDIPAKKAVRPGLGAVADFIARALYDDMPVAFLSLDKGTEPFVDTWHWVTLLSLSWDEDMSRLEADIADEGRLFHVNLKNWLETTRRGGGFVRLKRLDN